MATVASRDLRNHTADVLRRVRDGESVTITVNGSAVAELVPPTAHRRTYFSRLEVLRLLAANQADAGLRGELDELAGETTDDLGPVR